MEDSDDFAADFTTTGVLTADGTIVTGRIDFSGDEDWFALEIVEGEIYNINYTGSLSSTSSFAEVDLDLIDSDGNFLADGTDVLAFEAQSTGTIYISARVNFGRPESYELTANILDVEDDFAADVTTTGVLTADGISVRGNTDYSGDNDWFALEVVAGEQYTIDLTSVTIPDPVFDLSLFDSSGTIFANVSEDETLIFTAAETGTIFVGANALPFGSTGEYSLTAIQALIGGVDDDALTGGIRADRLFGEGGDDILLGDSGPSLSLTSVEGQIFRAFQAVFDRAPDLGGFNAFVGEVRAGRLTQEDVISEFVTSPEFQNTFGTLDNEAFVR